ncbi:c-type cytochrome [Metabacillus malikii]|uniref:Cytochrome c551 n=1 Tax=Metabacillus malikii TaxID=1504265 RepID=A0ABT9ZHN1_9BACI|nr:cytochrome c [Metabacillus malikii]MDQ0231480.1 cytochrome c551 [Metabacillus malikii]
MKKKLVMLLLGTSLLLAACGGGDEASDGNTTTAGGDAEKIIQQNCIGCHGDNLQGRSGKDLTGVGDRYSREEIIDILVNGKGSMPKMLGEADAEIVTDWLIENK